jgi:hypothetical protein
MLQIVWKLKNSNSLAYPGIIEKTTIFIKKFWRIQ